MTVTAFFEIFKSIEELHHYDQSVFQTVYMAKYRQSNKHKQNKCLRNNKLFFF